MYTGTVLLFVSESDSNQFPLPSYVCRVEFFYSGKSAFERIVLKYNINIVIVDVTRWPCYTQTSKFFFLTW